ncbi:Probable DNA mismatch repair protein Msh6 [Papilio machaon]|uniref:Probable DNA mismatch repair protein Msh6 n=1 Tax=Papilio machaon TaxID=76193 RepID=A0A0N1IKK9_PAPMA|nr:Probable DNA mismatch repair protein Msh6 [Papilio machaon]
MILSSQEVKTPSKSKDTLHKRLQDSFKYDPNESPKSSKEKKASFNGKSKSQAKPIEQETPAATEDGDWVHCKLDWLKPEKIRDANKRRPDHPDYDPTTLYVPPDFYNTQTPGHKQWWDMKSAHYDCVLFFKVGKFYELYHMDAAVGVNELGFSYMKLVYDRKHTTGRTIKLLTTHCHSARREPLTMWTPDKTLKTLSEKYYRTNADGNWPDGLKRFLHEGDALGLTPATECYLAIKALGGCVSYLSQCLLDIQILDMSQFTEYCPPDVVNMTLTPEDKAQNKWRGGNTMVLDAITLRNLRIVNDEGCLYDKLNFCSTAMGKRLLYQWVCSPSCSLDVIKQRQQAVKTLLDNQELCQDAKNILTTLPDLERLLAKLLYQWVCSPSCSLDVIKQRQQAVKTLLDNQELCQDAKNILTTLPDLERLLAK